MSPFDELRTGPRSNSVEDHLSWVQKVRDVFLESEQEGLRAIGRTLDEAHAQLVRAQNQEDDVASALALTSVAIQKANDAAVDEALSAFRRMKEELLASLDRFPERSEDRSTFELMLEACTAMVQEMEEAKAHPAAPFEPEMKQDDDVIFGTVPTR